MSVRVLYDPIERYAVMYDSVSGFAFGPLISDDTAPDLPAEEAIVDFLKWCDHKDPRTMTDSEIEDAVIAWLRDREAAALRDDVEVST